MKQDMEINQLPDIIDENEEDIHDQILPSSIITLQNQVKSLTSQVRVLKRIAMTNLFNSKEEMIEFVNDIW